MNGLTCRAFEQIVEAANEDGAFAVGREFKADVGVVGAGDILDLRQGIFVESHKRRCGEKVAIDGENGITCLSGYESADRWWRGFHGELGANVA